MKIVFFAVLAMTVMTGAANAMNATADIVKNCQRLSFGNADSYILQCDKTDKIAEILKDENSRQFFAAGDNGDARGAFLEFIPENDDYFYVNVVSNLPDPRYKDQTCYRFITSKDEVRNGIYATEICEYDRPDYYL